MVFSSLAFGLWSLVFDLQVLLKGQRSKTKDHVFTASEIPATLESTQQSSPLDYRSMPDSLWRVAVVHRRQVPGYRVEIRPRRDFPALSSTRSVLAAQQAAKSDRSTP